MKRLSALAGLLFVCASAAFSGTVSGNHGVTLTLNTIAAVRIYPTTGNTVSLTIAEPATAGSVPPDVTDMNIFLQYTVVSTTAYRIEVSATGTVPVGTVLTVIAATPGAGGGGTSKGTSTGSAVTLTNGMSAQGVLNAIQNSFTGAGAGEGSRLTYTYGVGSTIGDEVPGSGSLTVTYTLVTP